MAGAVVQDQLLEKKAINLPGPRTFLKNGEYFIYIP